MQAHVMYDRVQTLRGGTMNEAILVALLAEKSKAEAMDELLTIMVQKILALEKEVFK